MRIKQNRGIVQHVAVIHSYQWPCQSNVTNLADRGCAPTGNIDLVKNIADLNIHGQ
jgi:hypothetical protein